MSMWLRLPFSALGMRRADVWPIRVLEVFWRSGTLGFLDEAISNGWSYRKSVDILFLALDPSVDATFHRGRCGRG